MRAQRVWGPPLASAEAVVRHLGAVQAQEYMPAKWGLAQRAGDPTDVEVERALAGGRILRTHILRPTWHFVLPEDLRWMLVVSAPRVHARNAPYAKKFGLDSRTLGRACEILARAVEGERHMTRDALAEVLEERGKIVARGPRLAYVFMHAELEAVLTSGARQGKQHTYALFDERVPRAKAPGSVAPTEALVMLARRYFGSRGLATVRDFATWASLSAAQSKEAVALLGEELVAEVHGGRTYHAARASAASAASARAVGEATRAEATRAEATRESGADDVARGGHVDLLQGYDECIMSYTESKDVLAPARVDRGRVARTAFTHAIFTDGKVSGHFRATVGAREVTLDTFWYGAPSRVSERAMTRSVDRFGAFLGLPARVT